LLQNKTIVTSNESDFSGDIYHFVFLFIEGRARIGLGKGRFNGVRGRVVNPPDNPGDSNLPRIRFRSIRQISRPDVRETTDFGPNLPSSRFQCQISWINAKLENT